MEGEDGRRKARVAFVDKAKSLAFAQQMEAEARKVREGLVDARERARREAGARPLGAHLEEYRQALLAKGVMDLHAKNVSSAIRRLLADAAASSFTGRAPDRIQAALGRLKASRSARTANHALGAVKAFARWLEGMNRFKEMPRGLRLVKPYNEEADQKRVRRELTRAEIGRLQAYTAFGPSYKTHNEAKAGRITRRIGGPERAMLYRLAMATGFRANELRSLTPESSAIEWDRPTITVQACYSKNGREAVRPIARDVAAELRTWLARREPGHPVLLVPFKTARMLRYDLAPAGIPYRTAAGVVDFHALRTSYISGLIAAGVDPRTVQELARQSTITLTINSYSRSSDDRKRDALEGK